MSKESSKVLAFFSGGLSFVGCLVTTAYPEWLKNSQQASEEFLRNTYIYHGIWWRCNSIEVGTFQCDHYDTSILGLSCKCCVFVPCCFARISKSLQTLLR